MYISIIEADHNGTSFTELQTDCGLYWIVAYALRIGSKEDAELIANYNSGIIWC